MATKDLYTYLKGTNARITPKVFRIAIFTLCHKFLKSGLTPEQANKVARLRAFIEINFKNFND